MKVSKLWLKEWVSFSQTEQELASQLTMAGLEVDAVSPVAGAFTQVIVAEVLKTQPHPNADKLSLCEVDAGLESPLKIVCGAANVRAGLKVALAMIGAKLPGDFQIKESKLRGELSQGMLCSASELKLSDTSEGIMELSPDAPIGMDLREYLSLDDHIIDVDLTPNRADCFSVLGIAREVAVLNNLPLIHPIQTDVAPSLDEIRQVSLENPEACPRYCGRIIRNIDINAITPLWLAERLRRSGLRLVHPVVDVMNYVMLELGQPMHAFDLSKVDEKIVVRFSNESEQLQLLDGQEVTLNQKVLVIADSKNPLAMAGIMGGAESSVQADTKDVFLESAFFNPLVIAGVARTYGLFSDSSQRFERGVDPELQIKALERATSLIYAIAGGEVGPIIESKADEFLPKPPRFHFNTSQVKRLTGLDIPLQNMRLFLEGLGITILQEKGGNLDVKIPSYRFDLHQDVDLVEEIIRLYGYDKLNALPMHVPMQAGNSTPYETIATQLSEWFKAKGYHEIISYSFVDPELQEALYPQKESMRLVNPISSELSQMRLGMWPGLIAAMIYNVHRQQNAIKFFEVGTVFNLEKNELKESPCIAGLLMGEQGNLNWSETTKAYDFYDLKGHLQSLCSALKLQQLQFVPGIHDALHPGQSAKIVIEGQQAGWVGVLHPRLMDALDLQQDVLLFEMNLDAVIKHRAVKYQKISKYPQIRRDLSFIIDQEISALQIEEVVLSAVKGDWLKAFNVFDVYIGKEIPLGKKSLAIALTLQDDSRTLVDAEINSLISAIIKSLEDQFSIILRE